MFVEVRPYCLNQVIKGLKLIWDLSYIIPDPKFKTPRSQINKAINCIYKRHNIFFKCTVALPDLILKFTFICVSFGC